MQTNQSCRRRGVSEKKGLAAPSHNPTPVTESRMRWGLTLARITVPQPKGCGTRRAGRSGRSTHRSLATVNHSQIRFKLHQKEEIPPIFRADPGVPVRLFQIRVEREEINCICNMPWPNPVSTRHHADLNAPTNRAGTCPVSRLYGQVADKR